MNNVFRRKSVRNFTDEKLKDEEIKLLLKAAMSAPSAKNVQDWEFVVVKSEEGMKKIMEFHPFSQPLNTAPLAIIVCGNIEKEATPGSYIVDCAAATENILLQAVDMDLGGVWLGVYGREERRIPISKAFGIPDHLSIISIVAIGHPAEQITAQEDRFDEKKVHYESY